MVICLLVVVFTLQHILMTHLIKIIIIIIRLTCLQVSWWQPMCPAPGHPHSASSVSAHGALCLGVAAWPGPWVDCSEPLRRLHLRLYRDPPAELVLGVPLTTHGDGPPSHYPPGTHSCYPWFQCRRPHWQGSPRMEEGSLKRKGRAEPVQGSCRHRKWSRWLLSYHLESLVLGDSYPNGLGGVSVNDHTVAKQRCGIGLGIIIYGWLNGPGGVRWWNKKRFNHHRRSCHPGLT